MPELWLLSPGRPETVFETYEWVPRVELGAGFYSAGRGWKVGLVVLSELARTRETLVLRMLGRGAVLRGAMEELRQLSPQDPETRELREFVACLRRTIERDKKIPEQEREDFMTQSWVEVQQFKKEIFKEGHLKGLDEGRLKGLDEGRLKGLDEGRLEGLMMVYTSRFGQMPTGLREQMLGLREPGKLTTLFPLFTTGTQEAISQAVERLAQAQQDRS
jgi:hypothetical protein